MATNLVTYPPFMRDAAHLCHCYTTRAEEGDDGETYQLSKRHGLFEFRSPTRTDHLLCYVGVRSV